MRRLILAIAVCVAWVAAAYAAAPPDLRPGQRWLIVAARQNLLEATDLARVYGRTVADVRVLKALNGWYAVAIGPVGYASIAAAQQALEDQAEVPPDAYLANGNGFADQVFLAPPPAVRMRGKLEGTGTTTISFEGVRITLSSVPDADLHIPVFTGHQDGKQIFTFRLPDAEADPPRMYVRFVQLDPSAPGIQIVLSAFSNGAHCCTFTRIAVQTQPGTWSVVEAPTVDGEGYELEDVDGDGAVELLNYDNSFLYAFGSYSESVAPVVVYRLVGTALRNVTMQPATRAYVERSLRETEADANRNPSMWHNNGFLAGWVATNVQLGRTREAWARMLADYDRSETYGREHCIIGDKLERCPPGQGEKQPFPDALLIHLIQTGYLSSPAAVAGVQPAAR